MSLPPYIAKLRQHVGNDLLLVPSVALVVRPENAEQAPVLLVQSAETGRWTLPSGMIDPLESPSDAALREAWEETGLEVSLSALLGVFGGADYVHTYANGDRVNFVTSLFLAHSDPNPPTPQDAEIEQAEWFAPAEALALPLKSDARVYLQFALQSPPPSGGGHFPTPGWQAPGITE